MLEVHKKACGSPQMYEDMDGFEFLKEAHNRAEKLANMVK